MKVLIESFEINATTIEAANGMEALAMLERNEIDLVLLDIQMPLMSGLEFLKVIRKSLRKPRIIVLTQHDENALISAALELGASGYLLKACDADVLKSAIVDVSIKGYSSHNKDDGVKFSNQVPKNAEKRSLDISKREQQMLRLMTDGYSAKEIAYTLKLKVSTIESYRKKLLKKTCTKNTTDLVSLAFRTGIIPQ